MAELHIRVDAKISVDGEDFDVRRYALTKGLFELGDLVTEIVRYGQDAEQPDPAKLVGKDVSFTLERARAGHQRFFFGIVESAERFVSDDDQVSVVLRVVPRLWRLSKRTDCRIFQELSVPDIVKQVLEGAGVPSDRQEWTLTGDYQPRTYCAQYRETDLEFIERILAEEGIWYTVHMKDEADFIVLADDPTGIGEIEGDVELGFDPEMGIEGSGPTVTRLEQIQSVRSDKVHLKDYDRAKPKVELKASSEGTDEGAHELEVYDWPGRFTEDAAGTHLADVLLQSLQAERDLVRGDTSVLSLKPGLRFKIENHPYTPFNQEYLVSRVTLTGSQVSRFGSGGPADRKEQDSFRASFEALPTGRVQYRPRRRERIRYVPGLQTAWTTGPSGEEIYTNEHGEVKAQFHWDRLGTNDENSSLWMRTSQVPTGGSMLLPRMTWEVSVAFREGDADQPFVMGRVYNGLTKPPYNLPDEKGSSAIQTATTPGGGSANEIKMGDNKGDESMLMNGSYDMTMDVNNSTTSSVGANLSKKVGSNQAINITDSAQNKVAGSQTVSVGGNQSLTVQTFMVDDPGGDHTLSIGGNRTMMLGGDNKKDVGASSSLTVNGMHIDLVVGAIVDSTLASMTHDVGTALVEITAADRSIIAGAGHTETTGAVKIIAVKGGRGVQVNGAFMHKVGGAVINSVKADRNDSAGATWTEIAAGAQFVKADNIVYEAESMLTLVMGASIVMMMPAMIMVTGTSAKLDGNVVGQLLTLDN